MTDREKIAAHFGRHGLPGLRSDDAACALIESLLRSAAERAYTKGRADGQAEMLGRECDEELPADFPLVADSPLDALPAFRQG